MQTDGSLSLRWLWCRAGLKPVVSELTNTFFIVWFITARGCVGFHTVHAVAPYSRCLWRKVRLTPSAIIDGILPRRDECLRVVRSQIMWFLHILTDEHKPSYNPTSSPVSIQILKFSIIKDDVSPKGCMSDSVTVVFFFFFFVLRASLL